MAVKIVIFIFNIRAIYFRTNTKINFHGKKLFFFQNCHSKYNFKTNLHKRLRKIIFLYLSCDKVMDQIKNTKKKE